MLVTTFMHKHYLWHASLLEVPAEVIQKVAQASICINAGELFNAFLVSFRIRHQAPQIISLTGSCGPSALAARQSLYRTTGANSSSAAK